MKPLSNRIALLEALPPVGLEKNKEGNLRDVHRISLASALLALAQIEHAKEYQLCRSVAQHLLDAIPEPDPVDLED